MARGLMDWGAFYRKVLGEPAPPKCRDCETRLEEAVVYWPTTRERYSGFECPECGRKFIRDPEPLPNATRR